LQSHERKITLSELAGLTGSTVHGSGDTVIFGVCSLDNPREGNIALAVGSAVGLLKESPVKPTALIVSGPVEGLEIPFLVHKDPRLAFTIALRHFHREPSIKQGIDPNAFVSLDALIDPTVTVGPFAVIEPRVVIGREVVIGAGCYIGERTTIGDHTKIHPNVAVMHDVTIGSRCIIHPGVVIGSDGFGFTPTGDENLKVPQVGRVEIGDDVEIGANTTIDRATIDATVIGNDVKIDNLVQIAHNVQIGDHTRIAAQAGISGRTVIENNVVIAGQAGFQNGIRVGEGSVVAGQAGVTRHVKPGSRVSGYPARDHREALQLLAAQNRLPEILERLEKLEKQIID
jgi:UDP-3-O-[3-hydroxymyristoyl] glucosamine N-acyltransferase